MSEWAAVITAILTFIYVIATIVYVIFTFRIASFTQKATEISQEATKISQSAIEISQKQIKLMAELEENRVRPYVLFNIVSTEKHVTLASIKNYGLTAAYDIQVSITPNLQRAFHEEDDVSVITSKVFSLLPPNLEITDSLGGSPDFYQKYTEPFFEGTVFYKDAKGKIYEEVFQIDLEATSRRLWVSEREIWKCLEDINKNLGQINTSIQRMEKIQNGRSKESIKTNEQF